MNATIETLNHWGGIFLNAAWPMFWQSSLLIIVVFVLDFVLARKIRPAIRHALWMVVLVKLVLPPALALPTGATWWLWPAKPAFIPVIKTETIHFDISAPMVVEPAVPMTIPPPKLSAAGWCVLLTGVISLGLLAWLVFCWLRAARKIRLSPASIDCASVLEEARQLAGLRRLRLALVDDAQSPAVFGLFRPVILLPRALAARLAPEQLSAVLLHEAIHVRRGDVWINCAQTLLQIGYWWHPLLWLANARIRRLREEAVDDAVMSILRDGADAYAPTLLEVARFAVRRPLASLGFVGILESRSALRRRIERLVDFRPQRKAGVGIFSLCSILAFSAVALPMGQAPVAEPASSSPVTEIPANTMNQNTATNSPETDSGRNAIQRALDRIHLTVSYSNTPLSEVIGDLHEKSLLQYQGKSGINFIFNPNNENISSPVAIDPATGLPAKKPTTPKKIDPAKINVSLALNDVSLKGLLDAICLAANYPIQYSVEDYGIVFSQKSHDTGKYAMRMFKVDRNSLLIALKPIFEADRDKALTGRKELPLSSDSGRGVYTSATPWTAKDISSLSLQFFERRGINLHPPKTLFFNDRLGLLFVYATPHDLDLIESNLVQILNTTSTTSSTRPDKSSLKPDFWLQMGKESYEEGDLDKAASELQNALDLDPGNKEANYYKGLVSQAMEMRSAGQIPNPSPGNLIGPELLNVVLDKFGPYKDTPLRTVIDDLNDKAFIAGAHFRIALVSPVPSTNEILVNNLLIYNVSLESALDAIVQAASQPVHYSIMDNGVIFERGDFIHYSIMDNGVIFEPGDSNQDKDLETRTFIIGTPAFIDAVHKRTGEDNLLKGFEELALDAGVFFSPPKTIFLSEGKGILFVHATSQDMNAIKKIIADLACPPMQIRIKVRFVEVPKSFLTGAHSPLAGMANGAGLLTAAKTETLLKQLQSLKGCVELSEPEGTTITGQHLRITTTEDDPIVVNPGSRIPKIGYLEIGPVCDTVSFVFANNTDIHLMAKASRLEWFGYPGSNNAPVFYKKNWSGAKVLEPNHSPIFPSEASQFNDRFVQKIVPDGETLVLVAEPEQMLFCDPGDKPRVLESIRKIENTYKNKTLLAFVTATLVDRAGNRIHSELADRSPETGSPAPQP